MKAMLKDLINWPTAMDAPRYAGGHEEVLDNLFFDAAVIAKFIENSYQGSEGFVYQLKDGRFVLLTDYFGSCSGCDSWEDASDESAERMLITLANNAKTFESLSGLMNFLINEVHKAENYELRSVGPELLSELRKRKED